LVWPLYSTRSFGFDPKQPISNMGCTSTRQEEKTSLELCRDLQFEVYAKVVSKAEFNEVLRYLEKGFEINYPMPAFQKRTLLHAAAESGNEQVCEGLISQGADVNAKDQNGITPIFLAFQKEHWTAFHQLVKAGADLSVQTKLGLFLHDYLPGKSSSKSIAEKRLNEINYSYHKK